MQILLHEALLATLRRMISVSQRLLDLEVMVQVLLLGGMMVWGQLKKQNPFMLSMHCVAHKLALTSQSDAAS